MCAAGMALQDENSETAEDQGIQAMPTFYLFKDGKKIAEMKGANQQGLDKLIAENK